MAFPRSHFIGQMDSDTWINPPRLSRFLAAIEAALPADAAVWGGLFEHWERLDTNQTINCIGFSYDSPGKECMAGARPSDPPAERGGKTQTFVRHGAGRALLLLAISSHAPD